MRLLLINLLLYFANASDLTGNGSVTKGRALLDSRTVSQVRTDIPALKEVVECFRRVVSGLLCNLLRRYYFATFNSVLSKVGQGNRDKY